MRRLCLLLCWCAARAIADETPTDERTTSQTAAPPSAPTSSAPPKSLIEEIIVTGDQETTTLEESTHSVVVFTEEQLRLGTEREMVALYQRVPNVTTNPFDRTPVIRGIGRFGINTGITGSSPTNQSYVDGFFSLQEPNLWDARQVEVQRGAQNFASAGAMSGLDAIMTNDPTDVPAGRAEFDWAPDADDRVVGLAYGGPLTETLGYRVAGYARSRDGFTSNPTRGDGDWDSSDDYLFRLKLKWQPSGNDDTVLRLRAQARKTTYNGNGATRTFDKTYDPFDRDDFDDAVGRDQDELRTLHTEVDHRIDDRWRIEAIVGAHDQRSRFDGDGDGTDGPFVVVQGHADRTLLTSQARLFFDDGPWQVYFRQYVARFDLTNAWNNVLFRIDYDGPDPAPAATVQLRYSVSTQDWWYIGTQLGARYTAGRFSARAGVMRSGQVTRQQPSVTPARIDSTGDAGHDAVYDFIAANFFPDANSNDDLHDFNYLPTLDCDYAVTDTVTIGAKYERAARLAGLWFNPYRGTANDYHDEISDGYEVFLRASGFDGRLTVRANLFYTRIIHQQMFVSLSGAPFDEQIVNAQRSHNDGLEVEATWTEGNLGAWLSLGLLETQFDRVDVGDVDLSGNEFANAPPWTVSFGFTYARPGGLFAETDVTLRPQTRGSQFNEPWITNESRQILNARLGWAFSRVELSLYARNLLDDEYLDFHDANPAPSQAQVYVPGAPREVGMAVSITL